MANEPVIIKKIIKKGHAHHGGAWKLAYADFVTAMMAFFLLMWLLGSTDEKTRKGISEYFQDPYEASRIDKGKIATLEEIAPTEIDQQAEKNDQMQLEMLKEKIQDMIDANPKLAEVKDQIKLETTPEGLRVQIIDNKNMPMFKLASSETEPQIRLILRALAPVINKLPNKITINGHTDARPFPANRKGYSNWELSSDRANVARYELNNGGLAEEKILRVTGLSASIPYNPSDPGDPMNRRISIIVMNKKTEQHILQEAGNKPAATTVSNTTPPLTKTPSDKPPTNQSNTGTESPPAKH
jgi:chemotaxis protein MotB